MIFGSCHFGSPNGAAGRVSRVRCPGPEGRTRPCPLNATAVANRQLTLPEELILMFLNEDNGYSHQMPGRDLNCAVVGAVLAELSLLLQIDTDMESLFLVDDAETGNPALDPVLAHCFTLDVSPADFEPRFSPLSSLRLSNRVSFRIAERRRDLAV